MGFTSIITNHCEQYVRWPRELNTLQLQMKWIWPQVLQMLTQPNKELYLQRVSLFGCIEYLQCISLLVCVESICSVCCHIDEVVFWICRCFFYLQRVELSRSPYAYILISRKKGLNMTDDIHERLRQLKFCHFQITQKREKILKGN